MRFGMMWELVNPTWQVWEKTKKNLSASPISLYNRLSKLYPKILSKLSLYFPIFSTRSPLT